MERERDASATSWLSMTENRKKEGCVVCYLGFLNSIVPSGVVSWYWKSSLRSCLAAAWKSSRGAPTLVNDYSFFKHAKNFLVGLFRSFDQTSECLYCLFVSFTICQI